MNAVTMDPGIKGDTWVPVWSRYIAASPGWTETIPNFTKARQVSDLGCAFLQLWWAVVLGECLSRVTALYRELRVQPQSCEFRCMNKMLKS